MSEIKKKLKKKRHENKYNKNSIKKRKYIITIQYVTSKGNGKNKCIVELFE